MTDDLEPLEPPAKPPLPSIHGSLAPGRHITPELVALCERRGVMLPPPAEEVQAVEEEAWL